MIITSTAFDEGNHIPAKYGFHHSNVSPPLNVNDVPLGSKSLAIIVHDPDAPVGDYVHWVVWGISPTDTNIAEGETPLNAMIGKNDYGNIRWDGPAPPSGTHHYSFESYALDFQIKLPSGSTRDQLKAAMAGHIIVKATLIGLFGV